MSVDPWLLGLTLTVGVLSGSVGATIAIAIIIGSGKKGSASEDAFDLGYQAGKRDAVLDTEPSFESAEDRALRERGYVRINNPREQTRGDAT